MKWSFTTQFDFACTAAVLIIGLVTCMAVRSRLRGATLPLAGLFLLAADHRLWWVQLGVFRIIERLGYIEAIRHGPFVGAWYYAWSLLPVLLAGFFAWALWRELRRALPVPGRAVSDFG
ncbi:MAG: hypothetical protein ACE5I3_06315 [Phycisphaerae bacterium]